MSDMNNCNHWACNMSNNRCVGCGTTICPLCLQEPENCKCEDRKDCCINYHFNSTITKDNKK
jgi:hypothetical protein